MSCFADNFGGTFLTFFHNSFLFFQKNWLKHWVLKKYKKHGIDKYLKFWKIFYVWGITGIESQNGGIWDFSPRKIAKSKQSFFYILYELKINLSSFYIRIISLWFLFLMGIQTRQFSYWFFGNSSHYHFSHSRVRLRQRSEKSYGTLRKLCRTGSK